jgi:hypothetical protein
MNWQTDLRSRSGFVAAALPPVMVEEAAWDILLALHSPEAADLSMDKLASIASVPLPTLTRWLALLENRQLITGKYVGPTAELRAVLTPAGRDLLDRYLSSTSDLRLGASH